MENDLKERIQTRRLQFSRWRRENPDEKCIDSIDAELTNAETAFDVGWIPTAMECVAQAEKQLGIR